MHEEIFEYLTLKETSSYFVTCVKIMGCGRVKSVKYLLFSDPCNFLYWIVGIKHENHLFSSKEYNPNEISSRHETLKLTRTISWTIQNSLDLEHARQSKCLLLACLCFISLKGFYGCQRILFRSSSPFVTPLFSSSQNF